MTNLTRASITEEIVREAELPYAESKAAVDVILESISEAIRAGEHVFVRGFGTFGTRRRRARIGHNPKTFEKVRVPAQRVPFFKPGIKLLNSIQGAP